MAQVKKPIKRATQVKKPVEKRMKRERMLRLGRGLKMEDDFQPSDAFVPGDISEPLDVHTLGELVGCLEKNDKVQLDARVLAYRQKGRREEIRRVKMNRESFLGAIKSNNRKKFREAVDYFATDQDVEGVSVVGSPDFIPLVGGPFYKQLYYYDYIRMHARCFHAYHHNPAAKAVVQIMRDFTLGRDWKLEIENPIAKAIWDSFVEVNNFYQLVDDIAKEATIYGENFLWWLPNNQIYRTYDVPAEQKSPVGYLPRVRLVDPSVFWEIVTYPEDMSRVLYYQWVAPTQYELYSGSDKGKPVPSTKFIYQQIPASEIKHYRINSVSNEKRGRSDLFPVLGFMKRLLDSVNYSIISLQKAAAWSIDTTIEGGQEDVDAYVEDQQSLGTIPTAGSEFVHTDKVKRDYLSNSATAKGGGGNEAFNWALSMIAMGTGIPIQYLGTYLSGAGTRASALVATEPVAKRFEARQNYYKKIVIDAANELFKRVKVEPGAMEAIFPELVVQDRSAKLRDLGTAQTNGWISRKTAASIAAKELGISGYDFSKEQKLIDAENSYDAPLTTPGLIDTENQPTGISGQDKRDARLGRGF